MFLFLIIMMIFLMRLSWWHLLILSAGELMEAGAEGYKPDQGPRTRTKPNDPSGVHVSLPRIYTELKALDQQMRKTCTRVKRKGKGDTILSL